MIKMNYFQSSRIAVGLLTILVCVCDCSVKEDSVPVIISSKENHQIPHAPSKVSHERRQSYSRIDSSTTLAPPESMSGESCHDDLACLSMASHDRLGLEAIRNLHRQLDDDANGVIELSESDEFLREELKYDDGAEKRQKAFHKNDDMHVSVKELWDVWIKSEVHNWTVEQTADWLASSVELPQYVPIFIMNRVTGAQLPRLAVSNMHFLNNVLGIKDPIHKQKITLKAMDVVLFGPPKDSTSHVKDYILGTLILVALTICWYVYRQKESSQEHLRRMMKDMEGLQRAELDLSNLQKELERARQEQETAASEKIKLERRLQEHQALQSDSADNKSSAAFSDLEVCQLKQEIELLRNELQRAEGELEDRCWTPPPGLQHWLQLTHEIENKAYVKKKLMAEKQLQQAREACEKLRKKRSSLVGAFVSTHGKSIDEVDRSIVEARTSLNEVTHELAERVHRWKQIELMLGFNVINNSGLAYLENMLYRNTPNGRSLLKSRMSSQSQDDLDDDTNSNHSLPVLPGVTDRGGCEGWTGWRGDSHDSSSSERLEDDPVDTHASRSAVHFTVGAGDETAAPSGADNAKPALSSGGENGKRPDTSAPTSGGDQSGKRYTPSSRPHSDYYRSNFDFSRANSEFFRQSSQSSELSRGGSLGRITKSYSDEFAETIDQEIEKQLAKIQSSQPDNYTETNLNSQLHNSRQKGHKTRRPAPAKLGELRQSYSLSQNGLLGSQFSAGGQSTGPNTPEEDTSHSTDSGSIPGDPDVEDLKKNTRKHRIHFPKFSKKSIRISSSNPKLQPT